MSLPINYVVCNWAEMNAGGERELDTSGRPQDPRRAGVRILDTAEGVLIALRGCSLNQAFVEIVQTAKAHNVNTLSLADLLVALAQNQASGDGDDAAFCRRPRRVGPPFRQDPAEPRRELWPRRRGRSRRLKQGGVDVAVVVG
jgi:hypothetical protein